jgi:hypothetical protein
MGCDRLQIIVPPSNDFPDSTAHYGKMSRTRSVQDVGPVNPSSIFRTTDYRAIRPMSGLPAPYMHGRVCHGAWAHTKGSSQGFFGGQNHEAVSRLRVLTGTREMYNFAHVTTDWPGAAGYGLDGASRSKLKDGPERYRFSNILLHSTYSYCDRFVRSSSGQFCSFTQRKTIAHARNSDFLLSKGITADQWHTYE